MSTSTHDGTLVADVNGDGSRERGRISTTTRRQTRASAEAAPPQKQLVEVAVLLLVMGPLLGLMIRVLMAGPFGLVLGPPLMFWLAWRYVRKLHRYNRDEYPAAYERWSRSYRCGRCAHVYLPSA